MRMRILVVLVVAVAATALATAAPNVNPGRWEIRTTTEIKGTPQAMPPQKAVFTSCIEPDKPIPADPKQGNCTMTEPKVEDNTVRWSFECGQGEQKTQGSGRITYAGDTFTGEQTVSMPSGWSGPMTMVSQMEGKRLGECEKPKPAPR